jgi:ribosome-binding factor A
VSGNYSKRPYPRSRRVSEVIREVLAEEIVRLEDKDERIGHLTVTYVEVSQDMREATVYFDRLSEEAREALDEAAPALRHRLYAQMRWKKVPRLAFAQDEVLIRAERLEGILARLRRERGEN